MFRLKCDNSWCCFILGLSGTLCQARGQSLDSLPFSKNFPSYEFDLTICSQLTRALLSSGHSSKCQLHERNAVGKGTYSSLLYLQLVARPDRVDSAWIHESYGVHEGYEQVVLDQELNSATHMRFWNLVSVFDLSRGANRAPNRRPRTRNLCTIHTSTTTRRKF